MFDFFECTSLRKTSGCSFFLPIWLLAYLTEYSLLTETTVKAWHLHAVVENEAGRGPLGLTEGRGGIAELALLLGADLE